MGNFRARPGREGRLRDTPEPGSAHHFPVLRLLTGFHQESQCLVPEKRLVSIPMLTLVIISQFLNDDYYCASRVRNIKPALQFAGYLPFQKPLADSSKRA